MTSTTALSISEIMPRLSLSNIHCTANIDTLRKHNIQAVMSVSMYPVRSWSLPSFIEQVPHHLWIEALNSTHQELLRYMPRYCDFIEDNLNARPTDTNGRTFQPGVLIHASKLRVWEKCGSKLWEDKEERIPKKGYQERLDGWNVKLKKMGLTGNDAFRELTPDNKVRTSCPRVSATVSRYSKLVFDVSLLTIYISLGSLGCI
ncbi:uncharacterized protein PAC_14063 [Phialocephala subalpina]|uniref:Uncharacterized protein n=1 Tax=Phialocephala subalpina TaxID=576137 RepID=A0A1L7XGR9_9HELO|nr:uncharacterized protein PAC_14063 [Phialocephala subalpina]